MSLQNLGPAAPKLQKAEEPRNTSDVDVDQQLLGNSAGVERLPTVPLPDVHLPEACPESSVGEKTTSARNT